MRQLEDFVGLGNAPAFNEGRGSGHVRGITFGGAGIHPGGGVNGMPGRIAAQRVQRYLGKAERRGTNQSSFVMAILAAWGVC